MNLRDVLVLQKRELEFVNQKLYIPRTAKIKEFDKNIIKVIIGPRRAGKSFFAIKELLKHKKFAYLNFDDENLIDSEPQDVLSTIQSIYDNPKILFIDEIQNLDKWELFLNRLLRQGYNIIISGSNSNLLSSELATHLTGRYISTTIFPFSFVEYLSFKHKNKPLIESEIKIALEDYLVNGGVPEPLVNKMDYKKYLQTLLDSIIYKDIVKRYNIRYPQYIEKIFKFIISNVGNLFSFQKILKMVNMGSIHTLEKYFFYFESTFLIFRVNLFSYKVQTQIKSQKKFYVIDNGILHQLSFKFSPNMGKLYENIVAIELKKKAMNQKLDFYYYKTKQDYEIDFVIQQDNRISQLIQVCYDINKDSTIDREIRALFHASEELKCDNLIVITADYEDEKKLKWVGKENNIKFIPLWIWLRNDIK